LTLHQPVPPNFAA